MQQAIVSQSAFHKRKHTLQPINEQPSSTARIMKNHIRFTSPASISNNTYNQHTVVVVTNDLLAKRIKRKKH
jgi:hypothetical protein